MTGFSLKSPIMAGPVLLDTCAAIWLMDGTPTSPALLPDRAPRNPADRIIAATARAFGHNILTRDGELVPYAAAGYFDVVAC